MKKRYFTLISLLLALLLLPGCGDTADGNGTDNLLDPERPTSITVWTYYNGDQLTSFNALVDEFNATLGLELGIFVEGYSQGTVNDLEANVLAAAQGKVGAGDVPTIFAAYADTAYAMDQLGMVTDLRQYLTEEELSAYMDSYVDEGRFSGDGSVKIFPLAKSTEIFLLNKTDWDLFAAATGASQKDFSTMEGLVSTAQAYYEWTDGLTEEPNDGRAFFGRDAMANYFLIGGMQLGAEIFSTRDGVFQLNFDHDVIRKLWDHYYVPFVKGYFSSAGRFRSDDIKIGNILSFVGSSSGATFFPDQVILSDTESYPIEMEVFPAPQFQDSQPCAVQQGAGMVVTTGTPAEVSAAVQFLKWFTQDERNIRFSVGSGYLPVTKTANTMEALYSHLEQVDPVMEGILTVAMDTVSQNTLYTPKAFENGTSARSVLEYAMSDVATADRATVAQRLAEGQSLEDAAADFLSDDYFESWYSNTLARLEALVG